MSKMSSGGVADSSAEEQATAFADSQPSADAPDQSSQPIMDCFKHLPQHPTQCAERGIRFDFNAGLRLELPDDGKDYYCLITDTDEHTILHDAVMDKEHRFVSTLKKYFVNFSIKVTDPQTGATVFEHTLDLKDREVVIWMPVPAIGDTVAWFSYVERFQQKHMCRLTCVMNRALIKVFQKEYPGIRFVTDQDTDSFRDSYATYYLGLFLNDDDFNFCPEDYRFAGLLGIAQAILNVDKEEIPPRVDLSSPRSIMEPYVCISVMASSQTKFWNNPFGWETVVKFLVENGYRVLCIDKHSVTGCGLIWNHVPRNAEDFTGDLPLQSRINLIKDADFFIGLSSGLSWLAWCCRKDVVLISGFTHPNNEFFTPYRIINKNVCNSCWNDMRIEFDTSDTLCCPRRKGTPEHFECSMLISPEKVIEAIKTIPAFRRRTQESHVRT